METNAPYRAKFEAQLEQAQARLEQTKVAAKERMADAAIAMGPQIDELEREVAEAKTRLSEIGHVHDDLWDDFMASMKDAWEKATARFTASHRPVDDIAPVGPTDASAPSGSPQATPTAPVPSERAR